MSSKAKRSRETVSLIWSKDELRGNRLPVSGAFHTRLMEPAVEPFREALATIKLNNPRFHTVSLLISSGPGYHKIFRTFFICKVCPLSGKFSYLSQFVLIACFQFPFVEKIQKSHIFFHLWPRLSKPILISIYV